MDILYKTKKFLKKHQEDLILIIGVILISLLCFAAGYLTAVHNQKEKIKIKYKQQGAASISSLASKLNYPSAIFSLVRKYEQGKSSYYRWRNNRALSSLEAIRTRL